MGVSVPRHSRRGDSALDISWGGEEEGLVLNGNQPLHCIRGSMGMPRGIRNGHRYREWRKAVFAHYGHICHLCGHGGATDVDHLNPLAGHHDDHTDYRTGRPAHGVRGCPTCKRKCNQERGASPMQTAYDRPLD